MAHNLSPRLRPALRGAAGRRTSTTLERRRQEPPGGAVRWAEQHPELDSMGPLGVGERAARVAAWREELGMARTTSTGSPLSVLCERPAYS